MPGNKSKKQRIPRSLEGAKSKSGMPGQRRVTAPAAKATRTRNKKAKMYQRGSDFVVEHCEYVGDILTDGTNTFAYDTYPINPGNPVLFPWLTPIADRFETFTIEEFVVETETMCGTSTTGNIIITIDYDPEDDTGFQSKTTLLNDEDSVSAAMWDDCRHVSTRANLNKLGHNKFVNRQDSNDNIFDVSRLTESGTLYIATTASTIGSSQPVAELWVMYKIAFQTPVMDRNAGGRTLSLYCVQNTSNVATATTDALSGISLNVANFISTTFEQFDPVNPLGVFIQRADGTGNSQDPPAVSSTWVSDASGAAVPASQVLIKFAKDFQGQVDYTCHQIISDAGPRVMSVKTATAQVGNPNSSANPPGKAKVVVMDNSTVSNTTAGIFSGLISFAVDALAGSAIFLTVASTYVWPFGGLRTLSLSPARWNMGLGDLSTQRRMSLYRGGTKNKPHSADVSFPIKQRLVYRADVNGCMAMTESTTEVLPALLSQIESLHSYLLTLPPNARVVAWSFDPDKLPSSTSSST